LQTLSPLQPPRLSSTPASTHIGSLVGDAQVVVPRRHGAIPFVQGRFAVQGPTHAPLLQTWPPVQPPLLSSTPASMQVGWLVGEAQAVTPRWQGAIPFVQATLAAQAGTHAPLLHTFPPAQPPRASSAPTSAQAGWLVGDAQVVAPFRQGPIPWVHGTFAMQATAHMAFAQP
jgi:hypothetical protein